jgi:hypothetical protein
MDNRTRKRLRRLSVPAAAAAGAGGGAAAGAGGGTAAGANNNANLMRSMGFSTAPGFFTPERRPRHMSLPLLQTVKKAGKDLNKKLSDFVGDVVDLRQAFAAVEVASNVFEAAADATAAAEAAVAAAPSTNEWYKLSHVLLLPNYLIALQNIYVALAIGEKDNNYIRDPIIKMIYMHKYKITEDEWLQMERKRRFFKNLEAKLGDFHELLAGSFANYETLPNGHWSKCDVRKKDHSEYWEFKNRLNTINADSKRAVALKMAELNGKLKAHGFPPAAKYLALIHTPILADGTMMVPSPKFLSEDTITLNGPATYAHITGDPDFFEKLMVTIHDTMNAIPDFATYVATLKTFGVDTRPIELGVMAALKR